MGKWLEVWGILVLCSLALWSTSQTGRDTHGPAATAPAAVAPTGMQRTVPAAVDPGAPAAPLAAFPDAAPAALRDLRQRLARGRLRAAELRDVLTSAAPLSLKVATLQAFAAIDIPHPERPLVVQGVLDFLTPLLTAAPLDPMQQEAVTKAVALLGFVNDDGRYDTALKTRYQETSAPALLIPLRDKSYKSAALHPLSPHTAVAVIRASRTPDLVETARTLLQTGLLAPDDQQDLEKYVHQYGDAVLWEVSPLDTRASQLMKLNGAALSETPGKLRFIYEQWHTQFWGRLATSPSLAAFLALPNSTPELAYALWTEPDPKERTAIAQDLLALYAPAFAARLDPLTRPQHALVDLAVAYLDLCLSHFVPGACAGELQDARSLAARLAESYLTPLLTRPDAAPLLGTTRSYVESLRARRTP